MRNQRGNGRLGVIIWLALMGSAVFAAVRIIPVKVAVYEFHDFCEQRTRFAATRGGRFNAEKMIKEILDKAKDVEIPLNKKQIKLKRTRNAITLKVRHEVEVDLAVYTWVWKYDEKYESFRM